ncbi:MAG: hypothetical protein KJ041_06735 [Gammaproteobacteria bacterium]|nr:hypothetical protein [Gammaproteobacteria bacterium]
MLLEPREAAPGALLRWTIQAFGLIARGSGFWLGLTLLLCLAIFVGQRLPLVSGMLALTSFFGSILAAAALDEPARPSLTRVLRLLRIRARSILLFAGFIACAGALIWILFLAGPGVSWWNVIYTRRNVVEVLSADWFVALRQIFVYPAYALGLSWFGLNIPGLTSFFQFACHTLLDLPVREAYRAGAAAQMKNLGPLLGVGLLFILLPVVAVLLFPPAVPLLYCYLGALAYVSFREIFTGEVRNRAREKAPAPMAAAGQAVRLQQIRQLGEDSPSGRLPCHKVCT